MPARLVSNMYISAADLRRLTGIAVGVLCAAIMFAPAPAQAALEISGFDGSALKADGSPATEAGSHPSSVSTTIDFAQIEDPTFPGTFIPPENVKNIEVNLPVGFIGNPTAVPRCSNQQFLNEQCPADTQVGVVVVDLAGDSSSEPVNNLAPPSNMPAQFAFEVAGVPTKIDARVRTESDYGLSVTVANISQALPLLSSKLTLWGVPASPVHNPERGGAAGMQGIPLFTPEIPFLSLPTECSGAPLTTTIRADSWQDPNDYATASFISHDNATPANPLAVSGCDKVGFEPSLSVRPDSSVAGAPAGYQVDLRLPQNNNPVGLAEGALKTAVVTLPAGVVVSPSTADGLGACSPDQIAIHQDSALTCPESSKLGTVQIESPLLESPLTGSIYLAQQGNNPFGSLLAIYLVAEGSGVTVKLPGEITPNPSTGQLTATFSNNPQIPFTDLRLSFKGGSRAALVNPSACGTYTTSSQLTPYSGAPPATPSDSFQITEGCAGAGQFAPSFTAGTASAQAGVFSPFVVSFARSDQDQSLGGIRVQAPPGLLGVLSGVPLCGEAQANAGSCSAASQIGYTTVGAGPGPTPMYLPEAGRPRDPVYLTGGYKGAPFGLSVVVPAIAGPFNLGTVVVRAAISIDPRTAQITIVSDPLPSILEGIPLQIRTVNVTVDRPGFMFNPTDCEAAKVDATITSTQGAASAVSSPFQAANCATLPFKPKLTASTKGNGKSGGSGASLTVKIATKQGPRVKAGEGEANIRKVDVSLPHALSSRLTTLQKACLEAQFAANPAGCPKESDVGTAIANTPVLPVPLSGPAYLVSHGGEAFPDLVLVLQGDGVEVVLTGNTQIKKGITYSKFETVPDAPISSFSLELPEKKFSVLGAIVNLCKSAKTLVMPTSITAQNGAVVTQSTKVAVTGCKKVPAKKAVKKKAKVKTKS
jgi:hypothetical protein